MKRVSSFNAVGASVASSVTESRYPSAVRTICLLVVCLFVGADRTGVNELYISFQLVSVHWYHHIVAFDVLDRDVLDLDVLELLLFCLMFFRGNKSALGFGDALHFK